MFRALLMLLTPNHSQNHDRLRVHTSKHSLPQGLQAKHSKTCTHVGVRVARRVEGNHVVGNEAKQQTTTLSRHFDGLTI